MVLGVPCQIPCPTRVLRGFPMAIINLFIAFTIFLFIVTILAAIIFFRHVAGAVFEVSIVVLNPQRTRHPLGALSLLVMQQSLASRFLSHTGVLQPLTWTIDRRTQ